MEVNPLERDHYLAVVLPGGLEENATVHGSKPVMDLLVTLCASYHLNPSEYTIEFHSPNKNSISFKPNSPIGSLEAEKIVLKPKGVEEKIRRPYMPEASVRLLINYNRSHKAVVRVSPRVPLEMLLPVVCDKCEFKKESTVLLRDSESREELDLTKTLNDHGLREVYAKDTADVQLLDARRHPSPEAVSPGDVSPPPPPPDMLKKEKKSVGILSLFRRRKKRPEMGGGGSAPCSPGHREQAGLKGQDDSSSATLPAELPKKRRAPQPPMSGSQSLHNSLSSCHQGGAQRSVESTLRSTKRRAPPPPPPPPPPCVNTHQELQADAEVKGGVDSFTAVEEVTESDESDSVTLSPSSSSLPRPSQPRSSSSSSRRSLAHLQELADARLPSFGGPDFFDARCALANVLNSSVSKGALVKRLRNSATFQKFSSECSFRPGTQKGSDVGGFCAETELFLKSPLPPDREPEWEDPEQRRGTTTFKVVPLKKPQDPELSLDLPDQITPHNNLESEGCPEVGINEAETEEEPWSPDGSEPETSLQSPEPAPQETTASLLPDDRDDPLHPGSPLSESGDTDQKEVPSEETPAAQPASREDEAHPDEDPGPQPARTDVDRDGPQPARTDVGRDGPQPARTDVDRDGPQPARTDVDRDGPQPSRTDVDRDGPQPARTDVGRDGPQPARTDVGRDGPQPARTDVDRDGPGTVEEEEEEEEDTISFPPPPSPVFFEEDADAEDDAASSLPSHQPPGPPGLDEDPLDAATSERPAPTPPANKTTAPSRFAQAVALAVQRSRLQNPPSSLPSPPRAVDRVGEYQSLLRDVLLLD